MAEHTDAASLKASHRRMITRGVLAALVLAVLSLLEYWVALEFDDPTWYLVPFMVFKGGLILDTFMHIRALRNDGAH
jgi:cytochrome c oxidase subunit IV